MFSFVLLMRPGRADTINMPERGLQMARSTCRSNESNHDRVEKIKYNTKSTKKFLETSEKTFCNICIVDYV